MLASTVAPIRFQSRGAAGITMASQCGSCHLRGLCLPAGLAHGDLERLDQLYFGRRRVAAGAALYEAGQEFSHLYAVRSGTFKTGLLLPDGREQVTGFRLAGELLGLDGVAHGRHASCAHALEDAEVCAIPYAALTRLATEVPALQTALGRLMAREIVQEHQLMVVLGSMNAEERLATFLLDLSRRLQARGWSASEFHLRMSRAEIGSYLGLTLETVSRTFRSFQQRGLLAVDKRHIRILDLAGLQQAFELRVQ